MDHIARDQQDGVVLVDQCQSVEIVVRMVVRLLYDREFYQVKPTAVHLRH